ncbi:MAG: hypothetical protein NTW19_10490 [Planctomycetota bacterium]|nr:hypothetical protein [Planctomycetota bacterium]
MPRSRIGLASLLCLVALAASSGGCAAGKCPLVINDPIRVVDVPVPTLNALVAAYPDAQIADVWRERPRADQPEGPATYKFIMTVYGKHTALAVYDANGKLLKFVQAPLPQLTRKLNSANADL